MKKLALLLAVLLCFGMCAACGSPASAQSAASASNPEDTEQETAKVPETETESDSVMEASAAEENTDRKTISYPLDGDTTFSIIINPNGLISLVMGDDGFTASPAYAAHGGGHRGTSGLDPLQRGYLERAVQSDHGPPATGRTCSTAAFPPVMLQVSAACWRMTWWWN